MLLPTELIVQTDYIPTNQKCFTQIQLYYCFLGIAYFIMLFLLFMSVLIMDKQVCIFY